MTESSDYESVQVFIGVDVGKDIHHAVAVNRSGTGSEKRVTQSHPLYAPGCRICLRL